MYKNYIPYHFDITNHTRFRSFLSYFLGHVLNPFVIYFVLKMLNCYIITSSIHFSVFFVLLLGGTLKIFMLVGLMSLLGWLIGLKCYKGLGFCAIRWVLFSIFSLLHNPYSFDLIFHWPIGLVSNFLSYILSLYTHVVIDPLCLGFPFTLLCGIFQLFWSRVLIFYKVGALKYFILYPWLSVVLSLFKSLFLILTRWHLFYEQILKHVLKYHHLKSLSRSLLKPYYSLVSFPWWAIDPVPLHHILLKSFGIFILLLWCVMACVILASLLYFALLIYFFLTNLYCDAWWPLHLLCIMLVHIVENFLLLNSFEWWAMGDKPPWVMIVPRVNILCHRSYHLSLKSFSFPINYCDEWWREENLFALLEVFTSLRRWAMSSGRIFWRIFFPSEPLFTSLFHLVKKWMLQRWEMVTRGLLRNLEWPCGNFLMFHCCFKAR